MMNQDRIKQLRIGKDHRTMNQIRGIKEGKAWVGDGKNWFSAPRPGCSQEYIDFYNSKVR